MIKMFKMFLSLGLMAMIFMDMAMAADYTVGGPNGAWDQATDLATWSSSITFLQGDNLIFKYSTNHDVVEVSKPDFDSCNATNPLLPPHTGGDTTVPLTSPGTRYFICGTAGHCLMGMKLQVTTLAAAAPPPSTTPAVSSPPPSTTPTVPSPPPSTTPAVPSPPPKSSPSHPPSSKTKAPAPSPKYSKEMSPPPSGSAVSPSGSSAAAAPAPSSAAKFDVMGALTAILGLMALLINV